MGWWGAFVRMQPVGVLGLGVWLCSGWIDDGESCERANELVEINWLALIKTD
jgi:hypothetical protein